MFFFTPVNVMKMGIQTSLLMVEAQRLFALRMMGVWAASLPRPAPVAGGSGLASGNALALPDSRPMTEPPAQKLRAMRRAANSNVTRLARRAPGKPA